MGRAQIIVSALGLVLTAASLLVMFPLWKPTTPGWWVVKALPTTLSPLMLIIGLLVFSYGIRHSSNLLIFVGAWLALFFAVHILIITLPPSNTTGFLQAFDKQKIDRVSGGKEPYRLKTRLGFGAPKVPAPVFNQDIVFYTLPATGRKLLCDVWEPQQDIKGSGLAVVYLHGSAWCVWDKDAGTRKFFRHLTAQGHVVMDVAYRLYPETNIQGMVHDVKHAVSWIKENADTYGIDPSRVVLCGGSAGGHLSLLSAYTGSHPLFTPSDLIGKDIRVRGVISLYGPTDLTDLYHHTGQDVVYERRKLKATRVAEMPKWIRSLMGEHAYQRLGLYKDPSQTFLPDILGDTPENMPETYQLFSPVTHVHRACPPTLLLQGKHDLITSAKSTQAFYAKLRSAGVPAVMHLFPQLDHAYDLLLPGISPSAHNTYFDVDQFLGLINIDVSEMEIETNELNTIAELPGLDHPPISR